MSFQWVVVRELNLISASVALGNRKGKFLGLSSDSARTTLAEQPLKTSRPPRFSTTFPLSLSSGHSGSHRFPSRLILPILTHRFQLYLTAISIITFQLLLSAISIGFEPQFHLRLCISCLSSHFLFPHRRVWYSSYLRHHVSPFPQAQPLGRAQ